MIITNEKFLELLQKKEDEIISECKGDNELLNSFKESLFYEVHEQSSLESYLFESASDFAYEEMDLEYVFKNRKTIFRFFVSEVLGEIEPLTAKGYEDLDEIYSHAAFRWLLNEAYRIQKELLLVFSLRELRYSSLSGTDDDLELDSSEYGDFKDSNELIDSFVDEVRSRAKSAKDIINIEDYSKELYDEYFNLA